MKILAVDDDLFIVEWLPKIAARIGFPEVVIAMSGEEALLAIEAADHPFEYLLLNMCLASGNGIELYAQVRTLPAYREVRIIMLAALDGKVSIECAVSTSGGDHATESPDHAERHARPMAVDACASPVDGLIRYIVENPRAELSLNALAEVAGVSPRHLSRLFRAEIGMSPIDYVELTRVDFVRRLLEGGTTPIKVIAILPDLDPRRHTDAHFCAGLALLRWNTALAAGPKKKVWGLTTKLSPVCPEMPH